MPDIRPFRALRYSREVVPDLAAVVAPPYDVISEAERRDLLKRDPRNVVRLDLPTAEAGEDPDERYRRAARLLGAWRSDGTLRRDRQPAVYVYEEAFTLPGSAREHVRRGFFARVRLESIEPGSAIRRHERTLAGPKEDRYRLLRATAVNTSPVVGLYEDPTRRAADLLAAVTARPPEVEVVDDAGTRHRLWAVPSDAAGDEDVALALCAAASSSPITIADGHHRYETALRYRDERRVRGEPADDEPFEFVLMLLLEPTAGPLVVLPTHRIVLGVGDAAVGRMRDDLPSLFEVEAVGRERLVGTFGSAGVSDGTSDGAQPGRGARGAGRFGLWTRDGGAILTSRRAAFEPLLPTGGAAVRRLDVTLLGAALERLLGLDAGSIAAGGRLAFTKDAAEAIEAVDTRRDGADLAFLLDPTPASEIVAVAADGDVMPQKSTYIHPKALTGLVINPLEW